MNKIVKLAFVLFLFSIIFIGCDNEEEPELAGGITGIVTDRMSGEPISGANLTLSPSGLSKTSGSDGRYEFQNLEPQQYDVQAQMPGYKYNVKNTTVIAGQTAKCDIQIEPTQ